MTTEIQLDTNMTTPTERIRTIKTATCSNLSGTAELTYSVIHTQGQTYIQVLANSGNGIFSKDPVSLDQIKALLAMRPVGTPIGTPALRSLFAGKSVNTAGYLTAILRNEGLLQPSAENQNCLETADSTAFDTTLQQLLALTPEALIEQDIYNASNTLTPKGKSTKSM